MTNAGQSQTLYLPCQRRNTGLSVEPLRPNRSVGGTPSLQRAVSDQQHEVHRILHPCANLPEPSPESFRHARGCKQGSIKSADSATRSRQRGRCHHAELESEPNRSHVGVVVNKTSLSAVHQRTGTTALRLRTSARRVSSRNS